MVGLLLEEAEAPVVLQVQVALVELAAAVAVGFIAAAAKVLVVLAETAS